MKRIVTFALALLLVASAFASDGKSVTYASGDETVQGVLYTPAGKGPFPALVVIHEYWGLNDWVKEQASKLADQGYVSLAVDLYRGKVATPTWRTSSCAVPKTLPSDHANFSSRSPT